jgi:hypothetical protein
MQEADDVRQYFAIAVEVGRGADELHVPADAGEILPELRQQPRRGIAVVVERVVRKRVADQRRQNRAVRHPALDRKRRLAVGIAVRNTGKSDGRRKRRRRVDLIGGREGVHEIRIDVVTVHQIRRQRDFLLIERIA